MRLLILVPSKDGHHLEYTEHIALLADRLQNVNFIFVLHPGLKDFDSLNKLTNKKNIEVDFLSLDDVCKPRGGRIFESFKLCRILKREIIKHNITDVFLVMLTPFGPFIYFPIWHNIQISSILYTLYPYRWNKMSLIEKCYESLCYRLISWNKNLKNIYVLNDNICARLYNICFRSKKFKYLVDPYRPISSVSQILNLRTRYPNKIIVSHVGFLKERKGTFEIFEAIKMMNSNELKKYVFVFAGGTSSPEAMDRLVGEASLKTSIEYYPGFLPFEQIGEIVNSSDLILLPYHNTNQSSGIIGYGAQFNVPVAVPNAELLGHIVNKYKLGNTIKGFTADCIVDFLRNFKKTEIEGSTYLKENNVENFLDIIIKNL